MTGQLQIPTPVQGVINEVAAAAAKQRGMAKADAATPVDWATAADAAILTLARRGTPFQASDCIREGLVDEPPHYNMWGARFGAARAAGIIRPVGYAPSKRVTTRHSACREWIGTDAVLQERAA
ncbi:hypothetical protein F0L17_14190 [Streptomyces sp. TRM43335]|uniref:Uncharacterized protein n=1 Tax=Streptomyces taklimakanensis TaxID=2569853 RepID=A0A6G2BD87_9ACTN|nr:hypothetical protein [Streptomyces taklimakanensis]MTE20237.1 hypothetical protein [Streptomyces taklimakanensis]